MLGAGAILEAGCLPRAGCVLVVSSEAPPEAACNAVSKEWLLAGGSVGKFVGDGAAERSKALVWGDSCESVAWEFMAWSCV